MQRFVLLKDPIFSRFWGGQNPEKAIFRKSNPRRAVKSKVCSTGQGVVRVGGFFWSPFFPGNLYSFSGFFTPFRSFYLPKVPKKASRLAQFEHKVSIRPVAGGVPPPFDPPLGGGLKTVLLAVSIINNNENPWAVSVFGFLQNVKVSKNPKSGRFSVFGVLGGSMGFTLKRRYRPNRFSLRLVGVKNRKSPEIMRKTPPKRDPYNPSNGCKSAGGQKGLGWEVRLLLKNGQKGATWSGTKLRFSATSQLER